MYAFFVYQRVQIREKMELDISPKFAIVNIFLRKWIGIYNKVHALLFLSEPLWNLIRLNLENIYSLELLKLGTGDLNIQFHDALKLI